MGKFAVIDTETNWADQIMSSCTAFSNAERQLAWQTRTMRSDSPGSNCSTRISRPLIFSLA